MYGYVRHPPQNKHCMATKYLNMICFLKFNIQSTHIIGTQFPFITAILRYKFKGFEFSVWKCLELIIYVITTLKWFIQLYDFRFSILHSGQTNRKHLFYLKFSTTCLKMHFICKVSNCAHWKVQLCIDYPIFYSVSPSLSFFKLTKSSDDVCWHCRLSYS